MTDQKSSNSNSTFMQMVKSPWRFKLFLLRHLPMAFIAGLRVPTADTKHASVSVSKGYLTKNPFHSIYFACLAMAAELSTGILAMNAIEKSDHNFSLLVVGLEAEFTKKATGKITFQSNDGAGMKKTIDECLQNDEPQEYTACSAGTNEVGETVAEFAITWSFKPKT